jgi:bacterioferritin-associated ferredoxin
MNGEKRKKEKILSRIFLFFTATRAVLLEIPQQCAGFLTDITEVGNFPTLREQKQAIEILEEDGRGLVDSAYEGHARVGELADEFDDVEGRLGVQSRCGFCEKKILRLYVYIL